MRSSSIRSGTQTIADVIGDDTGSAQAAGYGVPGGYTPGAVGITKNGLGTLVLSAHNTYSGGTALNGGTLELGEPDAAGLATSDVTFARLAHADLVLDSGALQVGGTFANNIAAMDATDTIDLTGVTFRVGTTATYSGTTLTVSSQDGTETLTLTNPQSTLFAVVSDPNGAQNGDAAGGTRIVMLAPPSIAGTVGGQQTTAGAADTTVFSGVTITDDNLGNPTDTLTITLSGGGGTLSEGAGFTGTATLTPTGASNSYTLTGTAAAITSELDQLSFTPNAAGTPNGSVTTTFALSDTSRRQPTSCRTDAHHGDRDRLGRGAQHQQHVGAADLDQRIRREPVRGRDGERPQRGGRHQHRQHGDRHADHHAAGRHRHAERGGGFTGTRHPDPGRGIQQLYADRHGRGDHDRARTAGLHARPDRQPQRQRHHDFPAERPRRRSDGRRNTDTTSQVTDTDSPVAPTITNTSTAQTSTDESATDPFGARR